MHGEPFGYEKPTSLREFESLFAARADEAKILAGGTDLLVLIKEKLLAPRLLIDISDLPELRDIRFDPNQGLTIMAGTKIAEIERSELVRRHAPALAFAASNLGSTQVRWMATLAGNVCHASPAAETSPVLLAHDCELVLGRKGGERTLPISGFFLSYRKTALLPGEYVKAFRLPPLPPRAAVAYQLKGLRRAMEIDMLNLGAYLELEPDGDTVKEVRLAMGSMGPTTFRGTDTEQQLKGMRLGEEFIAAACAGVAREAKPIDDVRASAEYRTRVIGVLTRRALEECLDRIKGEEIRA
ncbi:xanthine dehydrogenase family protein subunit M [Desulfuromonas sp. TF]|uniref:FAD binding domain-containing protein n=1 Tax=Desulfuromonas sp. TF TaxID=1232410 RepID=UPI000421AD91|nr:xanthine dehydrogenase family protein subunit M [Desulfuromonas sp. TF]